MTSKESRILFFDGEEYVLIVLLLDFSLRSFELRRKMGRQQALEDLTWFEDSWRRHLYSYIETKHICEFLFLMSFIIVIFVY